MKPVHLWAIQIQNAEQPIAIKQWYDEFGSRCGIAGDVARKLMDIRHDDRLPLCGRRTADAPSKGYPYASRLPLERSQHKLASIKQVEPNPVTPIECMKEHRSGVGKIRHRISLSVDQPCYLFGKQTVALFGSDSVEIWDDEHGVPAGTMKTPLISAE